MILLPKRFHSIKSEIRVLGIDDGKFVPHTTGTVDVVGVVYRGAFYFEGVMHTEITIDGLNATQKLASMIKASPYYGEIRAVLLNGITFGGFNVVDIHELFNLIDLPVLSIVRKKPDLSEIKAALRNLPDFKTRWQAIRDCGNLFRVEIKPEFNPVHVQVAGISVDDAEKILKTICVLSNNPEALRVAHIIASGLFPIKSKDLNY